MTEGNQHNDEEAGRDDGRDPGLDSIEAFRGVAAAHALDAVDDDERVAYERALAESPALRDEADHHAETAAQLAALAGPVEPPPALRDRLMAQLDELPQQQATDAPVSATVSHAPAPSTPGPAERAARRRWFQRPGAIIAGAAAALLLIAGAIVGVNWPGPNGWGAQRELAAIAAAPDAVQSIADVAGGGEVTVVYSDDLGRSAVVANDLPDLDDDRVYELWYITESGATSAGLLGSSGNAWRVLDGEFRAGRSVGITVEPAGGSPEPTTEPIVVIAT